MAGEASVEFRGMEEVQAALKRVPDRMFDTAKDAITDAVFAAHKQVATRIQSGPLHSRSGQLGRGNRTEVVGTTLSDLRGSVYNTMEYAPMQEYGGTIVAKNKYMGVPGGPYLNIPTTENKTAAGVMRLGARDVFNAGGYIARRRAGGYGVFLDGKMMFVLTKQVTLPPRLGMREAAEDQVPTLLAALNSGIPRGLLEDGWDQG